MKGYLIITIITVLPWMALAAPLDQFRDFKPTDSNEAFSFHQTILNQRMERVKQNQFIPEDKKQLILNDLAEEATWMQTSHEQLLAAVTSDERFRIRREIIEHVRGVQAERRQKLAEVMPLPTQSPTVLAEQMNVRFISIAAQLAKLGKDTTALDQAIADYQTAVAVLDQAYTAVQNEKSVETLTALRDNITAVRTAGGIVRNAIQSIVGQAK